MWKKFSQQVSGAIDTMKATVDKVQAKTGLGLKTPYKDVGGLNLTYITPHIIGREVSLYSLKL